MQTCFLFFYFISFFSPWRLFSALSSFRPLEATGDWMGPAHDAATEWKWRTVCWSFVVRKFGGLMSLLGPGECLGRRGRGQTRGGGDIICTPSVRKKKRPNPTLSWCVSAKSMRISGENYASRNWRLKHKLLWWWWWKSPRSNLSVMAMDTNVFVFRLWSRTTIPLPPCNTSLVWNNISEFPGWLAGSKSPADPGGERGGDATAAGDTKSLQDSHKKHRSDWLSAVCDPGGWGCCSCVVSSGAQLWFPAQSLVELGRFFFFFLKVASRFLCLWNQPSHKPK